MSERRRVAFHEAGHSVVAHLVGRAVGPVTASPGKAIAGCSWSTGPVVSEADIEAIGAFMPAPLLPEGVRRRFEGEIMWSAAGDVAAETMSWGVPGRRSDPLATRLAVLADRAESSSPTPMTREELTKVASARARPSAVSDAEKVWSTAVFLNAGNIAAAHHQAQWLTEVARSLVERHFHVVERLAAAVLEHVTLSGDAVRALVEDARVEPVP